MPYGLRGSGMTVCDRVQGLGFGSQSLASLPFVCSLEQGLPTENAKLSLLLPGIKILCMTPSYNRSSTECKYERTHAYILIIVMNNLNCQLGEI